MTVIVIRIILVATILAAMGIILLGIHRLMGSRLDSHKDDVERLRRDVRERRDVVSPESSFHALFAPHHHRHYH